MEERRDVIEEIAGEECIENFISIPVDFQSDTDEK
jgi:hypothetical protein